MQGKCRLKSGGDDVNGDDLDDDREDSAEGDADASEAKERGELGGGAGWQRGEVEGGGGGRFNARGQLQRRVAAGGARTRCPPVYFCERVGGIGGVPPIEEIQPPTLLSGECLGDS